MNESAQGKRDLAGCAVGCCKAVLLQGESVICSDCAFAVSPLIRVAVEAEREACAKACEEIRKEIVCPEECAAAIRARGESDAD
jgi:hypothetical protein